MVILLPGLWAEFLFYFSGSDMSNNVQDGALHLSFSVNVTNVTVHTKRSKVALNR